MGTLLACLAATGGVTAAVGTVHSMGWLILGGGFTLLVAALASASTPLPRR